MGAVGAGVAEASVGAGVTVASVGDALGADVAVSALHICELQLGSADILAAQSASVVQARSTSQMLLVPSHCESSTPIPRVFTVSQSV